MGEIKFIKQFFDKPNLLNRYTILYELDGIYFLDYDYYHIYKESINISIEAKRNGHGIICTPEWNDYSCNAILHYSILKYNRERKQQTEIYYIGDELSLMSFLSEE